MTLDTFSFPLPETRFFRADGFIYKFKIRGGSSFSGEELMEGNSFNQELEDIIRTVLGNLDNLQPFSSTHFNVFPYKKRWEGLSKVMCKHDEKNLSAYPFILILYLEKNTPKGTHAEKRLSPEKEREHHSSVSKPQSKRTKTDSPLEEAILLDLVKELEAESQISMVGLHVDNPHEEGEVKEDPGHVVKLKSDVNMMSESPGEVQPGTIQEKEVEEEDRAASERSGFLTRLASRIFPFSLFFRDD
ncbi:membrane-anchored junction protein isoform X2 [Pleuronectes platessa]|uniref:membrane-anchored junction protein isoform X2 n=1 Tax=Pleuronectes platessa TaxID=8262 RepID=UPI00232A1A99|nr:membrane-anchored junction protein isoform X2 [Pleuronectes platessa]